MTTKVENISGTPSRERFATYIESLWLAWVILMVSEGVLGFGHGFFYRDLSPIGSVILEISAVGLAITTGVLVRK